MRKLALPFALLFGIGMIGCPGDDNNCVDVDGDGYGEGSDCLGADCDDGDEAVWMSMDGYGDVDEDGESDTDPTSLCTDGTLPAGYSDAAGTDCDDTNADAVTMVEGYLDADEDGYGTGEVQDVCGDTDYLPPGYADNADDCDDNDATNFEAMVLYPDYDGDTVVSPDSETLCTDGVIPAGYFETAGTDCDDNDVFSSDDSSAMQTDMCTLQGTCADTEMSAGAADMFGVGACLAIDCNGANPGAAIPLVMDSTGTCDATGDCGGNPCFDADAPLDPTSTNKHCWNTFTGCAYGTGSCSEISGCLTQCSIDNPGDLSARAVCMQMGCIEGSTAKAQWLYDIAQTCGAEAGCFSYPDPADVQACALQECQAEFLQCLGDLP